jgi:CRP/FNR family transcriptional regulator, cyclic AMP receptor protein
MDPEVLAALRRSALRTLSDELLDQLALDAVVLELRRGGHHHMPGTPPVPALLLSGLIRVYLDAADGRQITIRYARQGALLAIAPFFSTLEAVGGTEALTPSRVLVFRASILAGLARTDATVAHALLVETSDRAQSWISEIAGTSFTSLRQRVVRHLLDIATSDVHGDGLVASVSQQDLADAVGTLREVVVRIYHDLREEGLIVTGRNEVRLLDPVKLHAETFPMTSAP